MGVRHPFVGRLERIGQRTEQGLDRDALFDGQGRQCFHQVWITHEVAASFGVTPPLPGFGVGDQSKTVFAVWRSV